MPTRIRPSRWIPTALRRPATRLRMESLEDRLTPAMIVVNTGMDTTNPNDNMISLREAITMANANPDRDTIDIQATGTLFVPQFMNGPLPDIKTAVDIQGRGAILNGSGVNLGLRIDDTTAAVIDVTISDLTLSSFGNNSMKGGAILSKEKLTLNNVVFSSNGSQVGGAIYNDGGDLTLRAVTFQSNFATSEGGAVYNDGTLRVLGSTFGVPNPMNPAMLLGNSADTGGAIFHAGGSLDVSNTTFLGNKATDASDGNGGAVVVSAGVLATVATFTGVTFEKNEALTSGGGLYVNSDATVTVTNSTFGNNLGLSAGGGVAVEFDAADVTLRNSTLAFNTTQGQGGGLRVFSTSSVKLFNTIIAKNTTDGSNPDALGAVDASSAGNLIGDKTGLTGLSTAAALKNQQGTAATPINPQLFGPSANGGPTSTFALGSTSPAKDAGVPDANTPAVDQRGGPFVRTDGAGLDIGAFEIQATREYVVNSTADRFEPGIDPSSLTLREALAQIGTADGTGPSGDINTVRFDPALNGQTITLTRGEIHIDRPLNIVGPGANLLAVSGNDQSRIFVVDDVETFTGVKVSGLTLTDGFSGDSIGGGAVITRGFVELDSVVVRDSKATTNGGGINVLKGNLRLRNSTVSFNTAGGQGGGLYVSATNTSAATKVINSTVSDNRAGTLGGGVAVFNDAEVEIYNSTLVLNSAKRDDGTDGRGGGVHAATAGSLIVGSILVGNSVGTGANAGGPDLSGTLKVTFSLVEQTDSKFVPEMGSGNILIGPGKLGALQNNGGPTPTYLARADSQAVTHAFSDAQVNPLNLTTDQRGLARKVGTVTDLGATEFNPNTAPTISDVPNQTTTTGTAVGPVAFTVGDTETPVANLTVTGASSNTTLVPDANVVVAGTGASRTVTITPAAGQTGTATITLTVTDAGGLTATDTFTVTVNAAPNTAPTISDVPNQTTTTGVAVGPVAFTVGDTETPVSNLTVMGVSNNTTLVPTANVVVAGTGASRTVTITPAAGQTGTAMITLTVTDAGGLTATDTFTVTVNAVGSNTPPTISDVPNQTTTGAVVGPITFTVGDTETAVGSLTVTAVSSNTTLVPAANVVVAGSGATRTVTVTPAAGQSGTATVTLTVTDAGGKTATDTFVVTVNAASISPAVALVGVPLFAAGTDAGGNGTVSFYNADKSVRFATQPFGNFTGGVRTASGDFNGDGVADVVAGTGPGRATRVVVLDGATQKELFAVDAFEASFVGGVYVTAGDLNGDGRADLVISPDEGGGPRVDVYSGNGFGKLASFFGIDDPNFRGGARAATGDINGDGRTDLLVVAGFGGGPRVAGFDGKTVGGNLTRLFGDFFAFEQTLRNGIFVAAGDIDGDGFAELIAGGGPGGGPRVTGFSGKALLSNQQDVRANFFGGDPASRGGIRVGVKNLDGDARADIVVGSGAGAGSRLTGYLGRTIATAGTPGATFDFDSFAGSTAGVFVG